MGDFSPLHWIIIGLFISFMYFLPAIIGSQKRNFAAIFWVNLLTGWTFVGWIIALAWALRHEPLVA
jgi:hypothetical protein